MRKTLTLLAAMLACVCGYSQTNPYVANPDISPAPMSDFTPLAVFSFNTGNTGLSPVTYAPGDEVVLTITLIGGTPQNTANPLSSLGGTWLTYFTWSYNSATKTYTGLQNQDIPAAPNMSTPAAGTITINYFRTTLSSAFAPANGFSVDLTPNSASIGNSTSDDHTGKLTYVNDLPVTLLRFDGSGKGCTALLSWETAEEKNFDHFDVQYSTDGSNFNTIGAVSCKNNAAGSMYSYTATQSVGIGMYRLCMVDKDRSYKFSKIVNVRTQCSGEGTTWAVYPNPAETGGTVYLQADATAGAKIHVVVTNLPGQQLLNRELELQAGRNRFVLPTTGWARGTYIVSVTGEQNIPIGSTQKIVLK